MSWDDAIKDFQHFLRLEKALSMNSVHAYSNDIQKLRQFLGYFNKDLAPEDIRLEHLKNFIEWVHELGISARSQARLISGIKAFFRFLYLEDRLPEDPSVLLEAPRSERKLPDVLSVEEIDRIINAIDLSKAEGHRNKAMLEVLYSCGLRVSELIHLRISDVFMQEGYVRIFGKGDKERLVPIGKHALDAINYYMHDRRKVENIEKNSQDILFLNRRGKNLTRVMVYTIIRQLSEKAGIQKKVSPHTFRHSFATHLIDGGADLRAVQEMLGHESIMTTEIYTHLDRSYLRETLLSYHPRSGIRPND